MDKVICFILQFQKDVSITNSPLPILISSKGLGYSYPSFLINVYIPYLIGVDVSTGSVEWIKGYLGHTFIAAIRNFSSFKNVIPSHRRLKS